MADCCQELKAEIVALKAEVIKLQRIDEKSIIDKAVKQASQLLDPRIAAVGITATAAMTTVGGLEASIAAVAATAGAALSQAGRAVGQVAGLAARFAPLIGALAALGASAGTLQVLGSRIDAIESGQNSISNDLSKLYGVVTGINAGLKHVRGTANNALIKADRALGKIPTVESQIATLRSTIEHVRGTANDALIVARRAMDKFPSLEEAIEHVRGTANDGLIVARRAEAGLKTLSAEFNSKLAEFEQGVRLIHEDLVGRLRIAVIYFTEVINGMQGSLYKTVDIHSREIYRFNELIANLNSKITYITTSYVPTYVRTAIGTLSGTIEGVRTRVNNLTNTVTNLSNVVSNFPTFINNIVANNPIIRGLPQQITNVTNTYVTNVINNTSNITNDVINNTVSNLDNRLGALENQTRNNEKMNQQANANLDVIKGLILALPATLATNQTYQSAAVNAAATGSCKSLSGGCSGSPLPKMQNDLFGANTKLDLLLQAGQGALLAKIDKTTTGISGALGTKIPLGGIGAGLSRFMSSSIIDRTLNLVSVAASIHNAMMLSNSIKETLFSSLDNLIAIPSLIKDPDGETIDTQEVFTKHLDKYFSSLFGATEWAAIKAQWKAYSTIYSSSANAWDNARSILNDSQELMNQGRNYTAELGNAMADEGLISEENWRYKDPNKKIKSKNLDKLNRMGQKLEAIDNGLQAIEQVTSTLRNITETANEIKENIEAVDKAIDEANKAAKKDRDTKEEGLELPNFSLEDLF